MKILQVLPELNAGGVERGTLEIARFLSESGHEPLVVSNGGGMVPALVASGARHHVMAVHRKHPSSLLRVREFRALLEREKPDILHLRSRVPGWIGWLAWRGMPADKRPRLVTTVHGFHSVGRYSRIMTRGERVIAVSDSIRSSILHDYPDTPPDAIRVIHRGVELKDYPRGYTPPHEWLAKWKTDFPYLDGKVVLLLPGRITRLKGHEEFFALVGALKHAGLPVHGLVAGDVHPRKTAYLAELRESVVKRGIANNIDFLGHRTDLREIMAASDLVVGLSTQPEAFGRTVLEAMAIGRPVVAFDCGGIGELLARFFNTGRVPPGNSAALFRTTRSVLEQGLVPGEVGEPFSLATMCHRTLAVYAELATPLTTPR